MSARGWIAMFAAWAVVSAVWARVVCPHWFESDHDRFDKLQVGMTDREVRTVLMRQQRFASHEVLHTQSSGMENGVYCWTEANTHMKLVFRAGRLVEKTWTE